MGVNGLLPASRENRQNIWRCRVETTGYSQTRGPKIIWREKVATGDWSDAKAPMTPMKGLRRQMAKIGSGGVSSRREAAPQLMINRERRNNSGPFAASVVKFMELRPSMCRWPIGDPKHIETFRFCGFASAFLGPSIANRTPQKRTLQSVQGRHVRLNFRYNPRYSLRDNSGSVARAIWTAEKRREADPQPGSR